MGAAVALGAGAARGDSPQPPDDIQELVIPVDGKDSGAEVARRDMGQSLVWPSREWARGARPARPNLGEWATKERGYGVYGDLFGTGGFYALYEPKVGDKSGMPTLALAEHVDAEWKLRGLWTIQMDWLPRDERWTGTKVFYNQEKAPRVPFELEDVVGDEVPEVIVAGEMMKYRQASYVMKFDAKTHGLELLGWSKMKPVKVGNCMRFYSNSGNKAIWSEWTFLEWQEGKLIERAAWHSETPYNNSDAWFWEARVAGKDGKTEHFKIISGNGWEVRKDSKPFAKVTVTWKKGERPSGGELMEGAWFFEKLTGLTREDFPARHGGETNDKPKLEKLEDHATVEMVPGSGNDEARVQLFGK